MRSIWLRCALKGLSRRRLVGPRTTPRLSLLTVFDDGLAARTVLVFFLDHRRTLGRLALLDDSGTVPIPLAVVIAVAFANGDASTNRADANANTNFFSPRGRRKRRNSGENQCVFHGNLQCLLR